MNKLLQNKNFKLYKLSLVILVFFSAYPLISCSSQTGKEKESDVDFWLSDPANNIFFEQQNKELIFGNNQLENVAIEIDPTQTFQSIDGFGFCLTGGSARLLNEMDTDKRNSILNEMFATNNNNIGTSYLRISIGASDLSDSVFSYNDLLHGQSDVNMEKFSIDVEKVHLIPVLKEILEIFPEMLIMGSPWSPPTWMKTNNNSKGGSLKPEYYDAYALYFVKYIKEMAAEGIRIDAITVQNEPLHPGNNPSLLMLAEDQAEFIKRSLGPLFKKENIDTKIIIYDHNADRPDYPISILDDPEAAQYIDGSAFHLYGGKIETLSEVHEAHPTKNLYFTEQWVGSPGNLKEDILWHTRQLTIGAIRNWCRNMLEWNLAADPKQDPHTPGGCTRCLGAITIDGNQITRNPAYYTIADAAKFVRPGAIRINSNIPNNLDTFAFQNLDGSIVLIVTNSSKQTQTFDLSIEKKHTSTTLNSGAIGTFILKLKN